MSWHMLRTASLWHLHRPPHRCIPPFSPPSLLPSPPPTRRTIVVAACRRTWTCSVVDVTNNGFIGGHSKFAHFHSFPDVMSFFKPWALTALAFVNVAPGTLRLTFSTFGGQKFPMPWGMGLLQWNHLLDRTRCWNWVRMPIFSWEKRSSNSNWIHPGIGISRAALISPKKKHFRRYFCFFF